MAAQAPDLAIIDLSLPDRDGLDLLRDVRQADPLVTRLDPNLPLFVLSGRTSELDRLRGFERGCDDYLVKPFSYPELRGRVGALLRRTRRGARCARLQVGPLELDPLGREVWLGGESIHLSKKEFALLRALAEEPTRVFTREELLRGCLGLSLARADAHARLARLAAAAEAQRGRQRLRGQRVGRRLPPDRRGGVMMLSARMWGWRRWRIVVVSYWRWLSGREQVARACHELRGPITAARLGLEPGGAGDAVSVSPARLRAVELELEKAALALDDLTGTTMPRRAATVTTGWVDLPGLLVDSLEAWRPTAAARGVDLRLRWSGTPVSIRGDRLRLAQAAGNLIANAIEHGGGLVEVRARAEGGSVRIEVIDGGAGLPAPVDQLARRARGGRGTRGRGLAIAAAIAAAHGGRLGLAPSDRGARLVLDLPAAAAVGRDDRRQTLI